MYDTCIAAGARCTLEAFKDVIVYHDLLRRAVFVGQGVYRMQSMAELTDDEDDLRRRVYALIDNRRAIKRTL